MLVVVRKFPLGEPLCLRDFVATNESADKVVSNR